MITQEQLNQIGWLAGETPLSEGSVNRLRLRFPEIHFTYCMDDDVMAARPVLEATGFNLYLIDSSQHCLGFTQDMELATGVVVAEIEAE
ncbi:DUF6129 family protein [Sedimenticola hydrogenitrophicus]|uniref:DUF6129 family protein n=1 Tax=Sedimenticola hydrogenitrophicus TaxID=2967975 RepID=UPI0021A718C1|nr:DUF6129 family protein [Sedimenticola hydrogenitrophicus]